MPVSLRRAGDADWGTLARWILAAGSRPERQCLHSWAGEEVHEIEINLRRSADAGEHVHLLAEFDGKTVGSLGAEFDVGLKRAWLWGPHADGEPFAETAAALLDRLPGELPAVIERFDAYLNEAHGEGRSFYESRGFRETVRAHEFRYGGSPPAGVEPRGREPGEGERDSFLELYSRTFPDAYYTGERVLEMLGDTHRLLVEGDGRVVHGFSVMSLDPAGATGEIQMLGVADGHRGRGLGRGLLAGSLIRLLEEEGVETVCLNVIETNRNARKLYESVGFVRELTGVGFRKHPASPEASATRRAR